MQQLMMLRPAAPVTPRPLPAGYAFVLEELQARACPVVTLTTDDHRLAAIKTYLDAGFRPVLRYDPDSDMRARWDAVIAALGYEPVAYLQET